MRQQTWTGDRGAGNSDSRLGLAGPLPPLYLLSVTLEGPHPPGTQACSIRASFPPPQAKSQGKLSPPPFTRDRVSPGAWMFQTQSPGPDPPTSTPPRWLPCQHSQGPAWWPTPRAPRPSGSRKCLFLHLPVRKAIIGNRIHSPGNLTSSGHRISGRATLLGPGLTTDTARGALHRGIG